MDYLFNVSFASSSKPQYFLANYDVKLYDLVVVESLRGQEIGKIMTKPEEYTIKEGEDIPYSYILRIANDDDLLILDSNKKAEAQIIKTVQKEADNLNLAMKVTNAEYTLDRAKLNISYLSEDRVDFRELLKVLASNYHCRIELRQIGPRDKAKLTGGIGICGLPLCCSTFLNEFDGISITMAKNQMLALNIPKLSGQCGKLICCLKYEDATYTAEKENLPRVGLHVNIDNVVYKIASINIITKVVRLESSENVLNLPLSQIEDKIITNYNPATYKPPVKENKQPAPVKEASEMVNDESEVKEDNTSVNEETKSDNDNSEVKSENTDNKGNRERRFNPRNQNNNNRRNNNHNFNRNRNNNFRQNQNNNNNNQTNETNESNETPAFINEENEANMIAFRVNESMTNKPANNNQGQNNNYHSSHNRNGNYHHNNNRRYNNHNQRRENSNNDEKN